MNVKKALAQALLPARVFEKLRAVRSRRYQVRLLKRLGLLDAAAHYVERNGRTVKYGPFAGTIYPLESALSRHSIPKLLGSYEEELHDVIKIIEKRKYDLVIDVGCAEGYYAVGLARLLRTHVLAYDPEPLERSYCESAARLNNVADLVELRDLFRPADIRQFRGRRVLCVCDCEGFEAELFNADTIPDVADWDLLIELHGNAEKQLMGLAWPHKISTITSVASRKPHKELDGLGDQNKLLSEYRHGTQTWLWCDSRAEAE
jgi:SAM-dependent methyltransferase